METARLTRLEGGPAARRWRGLAVKFASEQLAGPGPVLATVTVRARSTVTVSDCPTAWTAVAVLA